MLQWHWPTVWSVESREAVRVALETAIRTAMSRSPNAQIRGTVSVDLPHLGGAPPELSLSGIRRLSLEHTSVMLHARYDGDFHVTMRGLHINLDTINSGGSDEADVNHAMPFYLPFEMTLENLFLDGLALIEIFQEVERLAAPMVEGTHLAAEDGRAALQQGSYYSAAAQLANTQLISAGRPPRPSGGSPVGPAASAAPAVPPSPNLAGAEVRGGGRYSTHTSRTYGGGGAPSSGYGVLRGAGGRRAMRPPDVLAEGVDKAFRPAPSSLRGLAAEPSGEAGERPRLGSADVAADGRARGAAGAAPRKTPVIDLVSGKAVITHRRIRIQLFGDPIKNFNIKTNFGTIPGSNSKVEGLIRNLLKPTIDRVMTEGITINLL
ncbi:hypothetical protein STCU_07821 [Strigomonas culicis]|uniref:Uncharacterized protein n=1 Tax=Strigomonas culicis TaxID=28005 RepID=S9VJ28_9TRYP|nr:hypothetical protein STCU_07821 [Strigomonas culicis]|eukprot:EPY23205.1 hypothetical protein STCU_07821 [Strigomonas culicis]